MTQKGHPLTVGNPKTTVFKEQAPAPGKIVLRGVPQPRGTKGTLCTLPKADATNESIQFKGGRHNSGLKEANTQNITVNVEVVLEQGIWGAKQIERDFQAN